MFATIAAFVFASGFALAVGVIAWMLTHYRDKMVAALLVEPMPQTVRVYHVNITRRRAQPVGATRPSPMRTALAA